MITTKGEIDEALLVKSEVVHRRPTGVSTWTEFRLAGELVRRDIHWRDYTVAERQANAIGKRSK